ncbi:MAG: Maf family protein [Thermovenabulum sp.]|uniref:Maf family protein n=1 Tax=Thermovenabulum sp. TaxID=3100335 RepID=UPI003C7C2859
MNEKLVLASSSPRRIELLKQIGLTFEVVPADIEEEIFKDLTPKELVERLAKEKVLNASLKVKNSIVVGADTVVVLEDKILGKPKSKEEALNMLLLLSGKWHKVFSGIAVMDSDSKKLFSDVEETKVKFRRISTEEAMKYVETGEPMDKAGAYAIQGKGAVFIEKIEGCYYNVVGLPIYRLVKLLKKFNIYIF